MTSRLSGLDSIDPLAVPLPHGTEVTTRVERLHDGRRIPPGVLGRVVRAHDGGVDLLVTGFGEVWFPRNEVVPRRAGQLEFALRREHAWAQLSRHVVLTATVGSRAWGLSDANSDTDVRGAFALPFSWTLGLVAAPTDLVSADGSQTFWELRKIVEQALRSDPNTLELLFVPSVRATDELGEWVLGARDAFVSKLVFGSFGRYALSQLDKLSASQRLAEHRDVVLGWLRDEPTLSLDQVATRLAARSPREAKSEAQGVLAAKTYLKQLYRSMSDQGLLAANDFASLVVYARDGGSRPAEGRELRPKNAYNLLRLVHLALGWLRTGVPTFEATGALRDRLLAIKRGEVPLSEVLAEAEATSHDLEAARDASPLPEQPNFVAADALLRRVGLELARRQVERVPGPFGEHAPPPPTPEGADQ